MILHIGEIFVGFFETSNIHGQERNQYFLKLEYLCNGLSLDTLVKEILQ